MARLTNARGITLVEIVITSLLIGVVFLASTTIYVSALKFFNVTRDKSSQVFAFLAMETIARRVALANDVIVNDTGIANVGAGKQVKIRVDSNASLAPNATPSVFTDDTWFKYKLIETPSGSGNFKVFQATAASDAADVTAADPEMENSLILTSTSTFQLINPSGAGQSSVLDMTLVTRTSDGQELTLNTNAAVGAEAKR